MKKALPITTDTCLTSYSFFSNALSILEAGNASRRSRACIDKDETLAPASNSANEYLPMFCNNFTTLIFGAGRPYVNFIAGVPYGRSVRKHLKHKAVKLERKDPARFVKERINENRYITVTFNVEYLANICIDREWYHEYLIYGYDDEAQLFLAVGYDVDKSCHAFSFRKLEISYGDFLKSLPKRNMKNELLWIDPEISAEAINLRKIKRDVFLFAYDILPFIFNAKVYRDFAWVLRLRHGGKKQDANSLRASFDMQHFRVLTEHKALMLRMMTELVPGSKAAEEYKSIRNTASLMLMTALKYNMRKKNKAKAVDDIRAALKRLRKDEPLVFRAFYKELKAHEKAK